MDKFFFPLRDGYYYGRRLNKELRDVLGKKLVQNSRATALLAQAVAYAGDGNYIEIGSLHGGSAITAALVKKEFSLDGKIYCIDPSPRDILENAKLFGVEDKIEVVKRTSKELELVLEITGKEFIPRDNFSCGFIDGDHRSPHPTYDWRFLSNKVSSYIIFDDCDKSEPGVVEARDQAIKDISWSLVHFSDAIVIFKCMKGKGK